VKTKLYGPPIDLLKPVRRQKGQMSTQHRATATVRQTRRWRFADADFGNAMRVNVRMTALHLPLIRTLHKKQDMTKLWLSVR
jgi:hypothetical protein